MSCSFLKIIEAEGKIKAKFCGRSMQPTLKEGMQIQIERVSPDRVKPAEIILYKNNGTLVAHRVIKILKQGKKLIFAAKGDNHAYMNTDFVRGENLIGIVSAAFWDGSHQNILIKSMALGRLYIIMGYLSLFAKNKARYFPVFLRIALKPIVDLFFLGFKKTIHLIYAKDKI